MGYFDFVGFWQEYQNIIEYMFGIWDVVSISLFVGFKFLNIGCFCVVGLDVFFLGQVKFGKYVEMIFLIGYNYIVLKIFNLDYVYVIDDFNWKFSYNFILFDSVSWILKYCFLYNIKFDVEVIFYKKLVVGFSFKYFLKIVNMDCIIKEFEDFMKMVFYIQNICYMDYFYVYCYGNFIMDVCILYVFNQWYKFVVIGVNIFNKSYFLWLLKIEQLCIVML